MLNLLQKIRNLPISRLTLISIVFVSLLPLIFLGPQIHQSVWDNAQREVTEKHLLIAQNLTDPLRLFVSSRLSSLKLLSNTFQQFEHADTEIISTLLNQSVNQAHDFNSLALLSVTGQTRALSINKNMQGNKHPDYSEHRCFLNVLKSGKKEVSATHPSMISKQPTIMMGQPVFNLKNEMTGVLLAEIDLKPIEAIRAKIKFGERGHSAFIDKKGRTLAHPNPAWAAEIKDLSDLPIVKNMLAGKSGVMEFYSPFMKETMIAGYAGIKELGWGVMVPQPKSEMEATVASILNALLAWSIVGIIIAVISACFLTQWITRPINRLAKEARQINSNDDAFNLQTIIQSAPCEVAEMASAMQTLINDLQASNQEIKELNGSLNDEISKATSELQYANANLRHIASSDHLTTIANRRFFESTVSDILDNKTGQSIGIMLVDIDNFKYINDHYGHAAGDYVLTKVASLLRQAMRPGDIIARYGGDEFVAEFESDVKTIQKRAEDLRAAVEQFPFKWKGTRLNVTLSIGITCHKTHVESSLDQLMTIADTAMYQAKNAGRNKVALVAS